MSLRNIGMGRDEDEPPRQVRCIGKRVLVTVIAEIIHLMNGIGVQNRGFHPPFDKGVADAIPFGRILYEEGKLIKCREGPIEYGGYRYTIYL